MQSGNYLILVRHGSTEWNESGRLNGTTDIPLSIEGLDQARQLGQQLAGCQFDAVLASSRRRSQQTAQAILAERSPSRSDKASAVISDSRLDEIDFGPLENSLVHSLERPGLELSSELLDRVRLALPRVEDTWEHLRGKKGVTLAVSHGYLIRTMICNCVLQSSIERLRRLQLRSCGATIITWQHGTPRLVCFNGSGDDICRITAGTAARRP